jgi:hypothetical protein
MIGAVIEVFVLLVIAGGIAAAVISYRRGHLDASPRGFLRLYLYTLALASFLVLLLGAVSLTTAGLATVAGKDFSYQLVEYPQPPSGGGLDKSAGPPADGRAEQDRTYRDDLVRGAALLVVGSIMWGLHWLAIRSLDPAVIRRRSLLAAMYSGGLLAISGLVTLVAIPWGLYTLLAHYLIPQSVAGGPSNPPGAPLAYAVVFLPVLAYFLWRLVQRVGRQPLTTTQTA